MKVTMEKSFRVYRPLWSMYHSQIRVKILTPKVCVSYTNYCCVKKNSTIKNNLWRKHLPNLSLLFYFTLGQLLGEILALTQLLSASEK